MAARRPSVYDMAVITKVLQKCFIVTNFEILVLSGPARAKYPGLQIFYFSEKKLQHKTF